MVSLERCAGASLASLGIAIACQCVACGNDSGAAAATGGSGGSTSSPASAGAGIPDQGEPHTPATGCHEGYSECGDVCAHVEDDSRHCGGCDQRCVSATEGCVASKCVEGQGCDSFGTTCDGSCVFPDRDANHCGSCGNRCASDALCVDGSCVDGDGEGTSCDRPLHWDNGAEESAGFSMAALTTLHRFECGPLDEIPTRWFRITATQDDTDIEVHSYGADDYVIEAFSEEGCPSSSRVACNDNAHDLDPELKSMPTSPGATYWVAVGLKGSWSGDSAELHFDH